MSYFSPNFLCRVDMTPSKVKREEPKRTGTRKSFPSANNSLRLSGNEIENGSIEEIFLAIVLVIVLVIVVAIGCLIGFFVD